MVHNLMVHEAMPGHFLQLQHSRRFGGSATALRAALRSGSFVEGWAVYAEQLMADRGYPGDGDPRAVRMQQLKMQLRMIINAILDARVHGARDDRGRGDEPDDRPRPPGGGRGRGQVAAGPAHLGPAVHLLRRVHRGHRPGRRAQGGQAAGSPSGSCTTACWPTARRRCGTCARRASRADRRPAGISRGLGPARPARARAPRSACARPTGRSPRSVPTTRPTNSGQNASAPCPPSASGSRRRVPGGLTASTGPGSRRAPAAARPTWPARTRPRRRARARPAPTAPCLRTASR